MISNAESGFQITSECVQSGACTRPAKSPTSIGLKILFSPIFDESTPAHSSALNCVIVASMAFSLDLARNKPALVFISFALPSLYLIMSYFGRVPYNSSVFSGIVCHAIGAFILPAFEYPDPERARRYAVVIQFISLALYARVVWDTIDFAGYFTWAKGSIMMGLGCGLETMEHHGPGTDITFEVWPVGRWCTFVQDEQFVTVVNGLNIHHRIIERERCYTACMKEMPGEKVNLWHGFITSAPAGQLPGQEYCPNGYYWGKCPAHKNFQPQATSVGMKHEGSLVTFYPES